MFTLSTHLFRFADLSAVRRLMSSSGAKSSPAVSSAGAADVCPSCRLPFDKGKKRRLVDTSCGHQRCYQCMFKKQECPVCSDKARGGGGGGGGRSMQSGGESRSPRSIFCHIHLAVYRDFTPEIQPTSSRISEI